MEVYYSFVKVCKFWNVHLVSPNRPNNQQKFHKDFWPQNKIIQLSSGIKSALIFLFDPF